MRKTKFLDRRQAQQTVLVQSYHARLESLRKKHGEDLAALELRYLSDLEELGRQHRRELAELWSKQGRELGPWAEKVLGGRARP